MDTKPTTKNFTAYITLILPQGYYRCDVWDDDSTQYPERFNTKFIGYTVTEIKGMITAGLKAKYPPERYSLTIDFIVNN